MSILISDLIGQKKVIFMYFAAIVLLDFFMGTTFGLFCILIMSIKTVISSCMKDDINNTHAWYAHLPTNRFSIVIQKFLLFYVLYFSGCIVLWLSNSILPKDSIGMVDSNTFKIFTVIYLIVTSIMVSLYLIQYFKLGALQSMKTFRIISFFAFVIWYGFSKVLKNLGFSNKKLFSYLQTLSTNDINQVVLIGILISTFIMLISAFISYYFYKSKDL